MIWEADSSYNPGMSRAKTPSKFGSPVTYTAADVRRGMTIAAQLIERYGSQYWPVLDRLKQELDAMDDREALLASLLSDTQSQPDHSVNG